MRKLILLSFILVAGFCFNIKAQDKPDDAISPQKAGKGTYQFIVQAKSQVVFADEILYEVERNRHDKEVKYLQLGSQAKVKILPRSEVNSPNFVPIKEEIIYE